MPRPSVQVGEVFGRWTVVAAAGLDRGHNRRWLVRCTDCGREVITLAQYLRPKERRRGCEQCRERVRWGTLPDG